MQGYGFIVRSKLVTFVALAGISLLSFVGVQVAGTQVTGASSETGFTPPFSGTPLYESLAPTEITNASQLNQPIGQLVAGRIARQLGLSPADAFTQEQYQEFISGGGEGGDSADAQLVNDSVAILTNTVGRPLYSNVNGQSTPSVLASYGLFVNPDGMLESVANDDAATRQVNKVIAPGGYMGTWMKANGAKRTLAALYSSPYPQETLYGLISQQISGAAQLVTNHSGRGDVGGGDVDGASSLVGQLHPDLPVESVTCGLHACPLGSHSCQRCQRDLAPQLHRPGALQRVRVVSSPVNSRSIWSWCPGSCLL